MSCSVRSDDDLIIVAKPLQNKLCEPACVNVFCLLLSSYDYNFTVIADTPAWFASLRLEPLGSSYYEYIYSQNAIENPFTRVLPGPGQYTMVIQPVLEECEEKEQPFKYCIFPKYTVEGFDQPGGSYGNNLRFLVKYYSFEVIALPPPSPPPPQGVHLLSAFSWAL
jgi:hypothetical protein